MYQLLYRYCDLVKLCAHEIRDFLRDEYTKKAAERYELLAEGKTTLYYRWGELIFRETIQIKNFTE